MKEGDVILTPLPHRRKVGHGHVYQGRYKPFPVERATICLNEDDRLVDRLQQRGRIGQAM